MEDTIIIDALIEPISTAQPVGEFLFYDDEYQKIRESVRADDTLPKGVWSFEEKTSDWKKAETLCTQALLKKSKDLQIAAWLTQSWMHLHSLEGLRKGVELMQRLCQDFWETLYPVIEDADESFRVSPLIWINTKVAPQMRFLPLFYSLKTMSNSLPSHYFSIAQNVSEKARNIPEDHKHIAKDWMDGALGSSSEYTNKIIENIDKLEALLQSFSAWLDEKLVDEKIGFTLFYKEIERIRDAVKNIYFLQSEKKEKLAEEKSAKEARILEQKQQEESEEEEIQEGEAQDTPQEEEEVMAAATAEPKKEVAVRVVADVDSRSDIYTKMRDLVERLHVIEPQSPISDLLSKILQYETCNFEEIVEKYSKKGALRKISDILKEDLDVD